MKAKLIITGMLLSLLLMFSGCATTGEYGSAGSRSLHRGYIYGGTGPYLYPGYGYYGYYGDYGEYPYWYYPPGGYYYPRSSPYRGHRDGSLRGHGYVNHGGRFMFHDRGNVGNHAGRHYFHRDEGWRQHHDHARADGAGQRYSRGGFNGSSNRSYEYRGGGHHGAHDRR